MNHLNITLGLVEESPPHSIDDMRRAIQAGSQDSALIKRALDAGRYSGMSGEDTYAQLAYHALVELERQWRINIKVSACMLAPVSVTADQKRDEQP